MPADQARPNRAELPNRLAEMLRRVRGRLAGMSGAGAAGQPALDTSILRFAWRHSKARQIGLLLLTMLTFPFIYISLEIPKIIVNEAINGTDFPKEVLAVELDQIPYLMALCGLFLGLVVFINILKWFLNVGIGMAGERLLRRLRYMLFEHVMRFPMKRFQSLRQREVVQSIMGECEQLGGFLGEILVTPIFQGGQLAVFIVFIFVQDVFLGLAAVALYPIQAYVIPVLQQRIVRLNKARVANSRALADRLGESIGNIAELRANGTARWHLAQVSGRLHENTRIRYRLFERKFTIKFINNFLNQLTPFFFFSIGGYLVIRGQLDFGALVAVLAAYKDLSGPWKALLNYFQRWTDFNSRFRFVVDGFAVEDLWPADRLSAEVQTIPAGPLVLEHLRAGGNGEGVHVQSVTIPHGARVAVTGGAGGPRERLMHVLAGIEAPETGRISLGGQDLVEAGMSALGAALGHVGGRPGMVQGTVRDNALYGLFRRPPDRSTDEDAAARLLEARRTGNAADDPDGDWVDYAAAGLDGRAALQTRLVDLAEAFGLSESLYGMALDRQLNPGQVARWRNPIMALRRRVEQDGLDLADLVEEWRIDRYNTNGSLLGNLLFGLPVPQIGSAMAPAMRPEVQALLERTGGALILEEVGWKIAQELTDLAEAVGESSPVLDQLTAFSRSEILDACSITAAAGQRGLKALRRPRRLRLRLLAAR
ncbi:MAG: ABC transporter ATP-binding protein, partial [Pseudomonadota bacterium]